MKIFKCPVFIGIVIIIFSFQVFGIAYHPGDSPGKTGKNLSRAEKEFYSSAGKLIDEKEYDDVIESADKHIKNRPDSAIYHLFKGLALVLKYADSMLSKIPLVSKLKESNITEAVKEFEIA